MISPLFSSLSNTCNSKSPLHFGQHRISSSEGFISSILSPSEYVTSSPHLGILGGGSHFIHPTYPAALSAGRAEAQMSRASLRAGPALGSQKRAMNNAMMLYKYFSPHTSPAVSHENAGISGNNILKFSVRIPLIH